MKVIIAGPRSFTDERVICSLLDSAFPLFKGVTEVVSGGAVGVDSIGETWAKQRGLTVKRFLPDYSSGNPKAAPIIRNRVMGDYADCLVAIWDGESRGTNDMIGYMNKLRKPHVIIVIPRKDNKDE